MQCNSPHFATGPDCIRPTRPGRRPRTSPLVRGLVALLVVALFGADTFQPVIGLVEVSRKADKPAQANTDEAASIPQAAVVSIHAWHWYQPIGDLWPAFIFQPTINAGSSSIVQPARSIGPGTGFALLPPSPRIWSLPAPATLAWLAAPLDPGPTLRLSWCREIRPIGPPQA